MPANRKPSIAKRRPAETASVSVAGVLVALFALLNVDVSEAEAAALVTGVGLVAPVVTAIVDRVRGV